MAIKLGLAKWPHWPQEVLDQVAKLHAEGLHDPAIAERMADVFKDSRDPRSSVNYIRRAHLKLPINREAIRKAQLQAVESQKRTLGIASGGELRQFAYREYARANGWPEELPFRCVQIPNVLAEHGPKTMRELAEAIRLKPRKQGKRLLYLCCSAHSSLVNGHGTYTGLLKGLGLVVRQGRSGGPGSGSGSGRLPGLYSLTLAAISVREECLERNKRNADESVLQSAEPRPGPATDAVAGGTGELRRKVARGCVGSRERG